MGIGTAVSKRVETRPADRVTRWRCWRCWPLDCIRDDLQAAAPEVNVGIEPFNANRSGNRTLLHRQHHLDNTRHRTRRLRMPHVRLDRAHQQRVPRAVLQEQIGNAIQLDRVADRCSRAVRLKVRRLVGAEAPRKRIRSARRRGLPGGAGLRDAAGLAVGVDGRAADDAADGVAVADRVAEPLEVDGPDAFCAAVAVGCGVEGVAGGRCGKRLNVSMYV